MRERNNNIIFSKFIIYINTNITLHFTYSENLFTKEKKFNDTISKMDENHNHYQDSSKYLAEHYGSRLADQKSYESEEGWN